MNTKTALVYLNNDHAILQDFCKIALTYIFIVAYALTVVAVRMPTSTFKLILNQHQL